MKRPLAAACPLFAAGVWVFVNLSLFWGIIICAAFAVAALAVCCFFRRYAALSVILALAVSAGIFWGWASYTIWTKPAMEHAGRRTEAEMLVTDYPYESEYGWAVPVKLFGVPTALFTTYSPDVRPGDMISGAVNIGEYTRGGYKLKAVQSGDLKIHKAGRIPLTMFAAQLRYEMLNRITRLFPRGADFAAALLTGDRSGFSSAFSSALSVSGLSHTVSVSGLHVSFVVGVFIWIFGGVRRAAPFALPFVVLFVAVVGFPPSAVRAGIMIIFMLIAALLKRDYDPRVSLSAALALIVLFQPEAVNDIGLQFSFAATFGIISFAGTWSAAVFGRFPNLRGWLFRPVVKTLSTTAAALLPTMPLSAYYFGMISLAAPLSNIIALPLISVLFIGSFAAVGVSYIFMPLARIIAAVMGWGFEFIKGVVYIIDKFPFSALYVSEATTFAILLFQYTIITLCYISWRRNGVFRPVMPVCASVCGLCAVILSTALYHDLSDTMRVTAVDVGQGQGIVLSAGARTVVVDCGGYGAGREIMKEVLSRGRSSIDAIILTHGHADHANGVAELLERARVGALIIYEGDYDDKGIAAAADDAGVPVIRLTSDAALQAGGCEITLLVPRMSGGSENELCMAVLAEYRGFTMLVTGDLGMDEERRLLRTAEIPSLDLLMVGHHGSKYSTGDTFLYYTEPKTAIISTGANNYGHPADEALSRLDAHGVTVYRTDLHGSVTYTVGGK